MTTVTVLSGPERRRRWTSAEKLRIVEESLAPGASIVEVARRHDVHRNLVTAWRRQVHTGVLSCGPGPMHGEKQGGAAKDSHRQKRAFQRLSQHGNLAL
ncbi:transposase [Bradyrhizobium liaoningense]|uniref:transposase n=1 Tax=Bradyrhizobium liaoningense TaxID=43992 RepID=UPI001BA85AB5|nr:transposase [Bradyrhizobium liaoningense]